MSGLANNTNIVAYLFSDPTAAACFATYGGATAVCNAFGGTAYVNYILQPGKTCSSFADINIGPYAFTNPVSANTFARNVCAYTVLVNLPACIALGTSCTFTCFANSAYGIPCMTAEYASGNTGFFNQVFALNSCAQLTALVTCNSSFISCYYKITTPFVDKFNCFWANRAAVCSFSINAPAGTPNGSIRTPLLECCLSTAESAYYSWNFCYLRNPISSSNNGNFILLGGGFTGTTNYGSTVCHQFCYCIDAVNYCTMCHITANTSGFSVSSPAMLYSNDNGCTFCRLPGYCIPNTFFCCVCCDGFQYNPCSSQIAKVEIQWGLGGFTCEGSIWQGFRINNLCCKSHGVWGYACTTVLANNTPGAWTVCLGSFPFMFTTFCCGYFSGIGGDCLTNTFAAGPTGAGFNMASGSCCACGIHKFRFVIGKMTGSANTFAYCISPPNAYTSQYGCCYYCAILRGSPFGSAGTAATLNPFYCNIAAFLSCTNFSACYPTISFMTCTYANTNNIRAWIFQLHDVNSGSGCCYYTSGYYNYSSSSVAQGASCTLLEWNCGTARGCTISNSYGPYENIGAIVPIANTMLLIGNASQYCSTVDDASTGWTCYGYTQFMSANFMHTWCNNFTWGSSHFSCADGYGTVEPSCAFTSYHIQCFTLNNGVYGIGTGTAYTNYWPNLGYTGVCYCCFDFCNSPCVSKTFAGHIVQINPTNNNFVARLTPVCTQAKEAEVPLWMYNYPTDGSNANTIYGRWDCALQTQLSCSSYCINNPCGGKLYCNILLASCASSTVKGSGGLYNCALYNDDRIPGCARPAFCCSFFMIHSQGCCFYISGWPCAIVYGGNFGAPWGSNTSTTTVGTYSSTSASCLIALCDVQSCALDYGRCIYQGPSYGWTCRYFHCSYLCFCTI